MKARVFFDAFAECVVNVAVGLKHPHLLPTARNLSVSAIAVRHGADAGEATGRMFDRLWHDMQKPESQP